MLPCAGTQLLFSWDFFSQPSFLATNRHFGPTVFGPQPLLALLSTGTALDDLLEQLWTKRFFATIDYKSFFSGTDFMQAKKLKRKCIKSVLAILRAQDLQSVWFSCRSACFLVHHHLLPVSVCCSLGLSLVPAPLMPSQRAAVASGVKAGILAWSHHMWGPWLVGGPWIFSGWWSWRLLPPVRFLP